MNHLSSNHLILAGGAFLLGAALGYTFGYSQGNMHYGSDSLSSQMPASFEECVAAGYPIAESYPRQCRTPDGYNYIEELPDGAIPPAPGDDESPSGTSAYIGPGCAVGGCSGELCGAAGEVDSLVSACIFKPEFSCYKTARCEKQASGVCGWTQSTALKACLKSPPVVK